MVSNISKVDSNLSKCIMLLNSSFTCSMICHYSVYDSGRTLYGVKMNDG